MTDSEAADLFEQALTRDDDAYLDAEARLRESAGASDVLRARLEADDAVERLLASVLLEWAEGSGDDFAAVESYLDQLDRRFVGTVAGSPPVRGVVDSLTARYGARLADFLALRLVKQPRSPRWRARTALAYLERHPTPSVTEALLRFAATTGEPQLQAGAVRAIRAVGDARLPEKLAAERRRLAAAGRTLPPAVAGLA